MASEQWDTVQEESATRVVFDEYGDSIKGTFIGPEEIAPQNGEPFTLLLLRGDDDVVYALNSSYKLDQAFGKVNPGDYVRVTYVKEIDTGEASPMKDFKVEVRKG